MSDNLQRQNNKKLDHGGTCSLGFVLREESTKPFRDVLELQASGFKSRNLKAESITTISKLMVVLGQSLILVICKT